MKKRVLFINGHLNAGGCERSLVDVLRHFDYTEYQVDLLLLEELGDYFDEIPAEVDVKLYSLNRAFGPLLKCAVDSIRSRDWFSLWFRFVYLHSRFLGKGCLKWTKGCFPRLQKRYDAVIAYRPGICTDFAAYIVSADTRISWWHHGAFTYSERQAEDVNLAYARMDKIVAVSRSSAEIVKSHFSNARDKVYVIPNMICSEELAEKAREEDLYDDRDFRGLRLVSVGRMEPEKNMGICVEVGKLLSAEGLSFRWTLVGDGQESQTIHERIEELGLEDCFCMTGRLKNPYPQIEAADILVHPSTVESQGLTILEAMALSKPVIVVESEGPKEFIQSGSNGILVKNEARAIADAIIHIVKDDGLRNKLAAEGKKTAEAFDPVYLVPEIEKLAD